jgi:hypothetical protein
MDWAPRTPQATCLARLDFTASARTLSEILGRVAQALATGRAAREVSPPAPPAGGRGRAR